MYSNMCTYMSFASQYTVTRVAMRRVVTTCLNINWLLHYWRCVDLRVDVNGEWDRQKSLPDPVDPKFGYKMPGKVVQWLDDSK